MFFDVLGMFGCLFGCFFSFLFLFFKNIKNMFFWLKCGVFLVFSDLFVFHRIFERGFSRIFISLSLRKARMGCLLIGNVLIICLAKLCV